MGDNYPPMYHYTYYSYESWGRGYIGRRSCSCLPEEDYYFGTYSDKTFNPNNKIILSLHETKEEAADAEVRLHAFYQVHLNPHFANKARQTSRKFFNNLTLEQRKAQSALVTRTNSKSENPFRKRGEESMSHGRRWVTNSSRCREKYLRPGEEIPEGWVAGRMKRPSRSDESRQKTSNALKGKGKSEEHKEKLREALSNYWKGVKSQGKS